MSKKVFRLIVVLFVLVLGLAGFVIFKSEQRNTSVKETIEATTKNIFPFGNNSTPENPTNTDEEGSLDDTQTETPETYQRIKKIISVPVSGMTQINKTETETITNETGEEVVSEKIVPYIRYVEKITGNIYDLNTETGVAKRITNTTIPNSYEALFADSGNTVIYRYENKDGDIETYSAKIEERLDGPSSLSGLYLPKNISTLSVSPDQKSIFYIYPSGDRVVGVKSLTNNSSVSQIFESSFGEWLAEWTNERSINLTTKASGFATGYTYTLDPITKSFTKVLGGISGMTTKPNQSLSLYLINDGGTGKLNLYIYKNTTKKTTLLGLSTLPEKCVWTKEGIVAYCAVPENRGFGVFPDDWYMGVSKWTDAVWKVDTSNNLSSLIIKTRSSSGENIDIVNPTLSEDENVLYFKNKYDESVWSIDL